jgi:curli production assembly/transport component CsgG
MRKLLILPFFLLLSGCAVTFDQVVNREPARVQSAQRSEFLDIAPPRDGKITLAVYNFSDKTGQKKSNDRVAQFSTAVTQGAESWLIKSLHEIGGGSWFRVVERVGLDNLIKERQIIRQMRDLYEGKDSKPLPPLMFAGLIIEGGIISYDTNIKTGGAGVRFLGVGPSTQYRQDQVTVSLRLVSVSTGEILSSINVEKNILSVGNSVSVLKFYDMDTKAFEFEAGATINEPTNYAVRAAIQAAVLELVRDGVNKNLWQFAKETK